MMTVSAYQRKNSILGFPKPDEQSALYYVNDQWRFDELHIPDTPSEEEFALPGSTNAPGIVGSNPQNPLELTLISDEDVLPSPPSELDETLTNEPIQEIPQFSKPSGQKTIPKAIVKSSPVVYSTPSPEISVGPLEAPLTPNPSNVPRRQRAFRQSFCISRN